MALVELGRAAVEFLEDALRALVDVQFVEDAVHLREQGAASRSSASSPLAAIGVVIMTAKPSMASDM